MYRLNTVRIKYSIEGKSYNTCKVIKYIFNDMQS
jgi:hypothetical protein